MPTLTEIRNEVRDRGIAILTRHRKPVPVYSPGPCKPTIETARDVETPPHVETELERTANAMKEIFRITIRNLGTLPHGVHYNDKVFLETDKCWIGDHGQEVRLLAAVTDQGELRMFEPTERKDNGEWNLDAAISRPASDQETIDYALPLMATVKIRSANARAKAIIVDRGENNPHDSEDTRRLTRDAINIEVSMQRLSRLEPPAE